MTNDSKSLAPAAGEFRVFVGDDGVTHVHVRIAEGTVWLSQKLMAELYGKDIRTIIKHLQAIFEEGELDPGATIRKFRIVQPEGHRSVSRLDRRAGRERNRERGMTTLPTIRKVRTVWLAQGGA